MVSRSCIEFLTGVVHGRAHRRRGHVISEVGGRGLSFGVPTQVKGVRAYLTLAYHQPSTIILII